MAKSKRTPPTAERRSAPGPERGPAVSAEDRRKLATCCAFFQAVQYREAGPDNLRESDVEKAVDEISAAIETSCGRRERRGSKRE